MEVDFPRVICLRCRAENELDAKFCEECGGPLTRTGRRQEKHADALRLLEDTHAWFKGTRGARGFTPRAQRGGLGGRPEPPM